MKLTDLKEANDLIQKLTEKESNVVNYMQASDKCCHKPVSLVDLVYSKEVQDKYSHARRHKPVIDYMICCYIGKMARKGILDNGCMNHGKLVNFGYYRLSKKTKEFLKVASCS